MGADDFDASTVEGSTQRRAGPSRIHLAHGDADIAYHVEWGFRAEAVLWNGNFPTGINLHPHATELRSWLLRKGGYSLISKDDNGDVDSLSNPYSFTCSVFAAILARAVNDSHDFATGTASYVGMEAEVERIRITNELTLYMSRFCEAAIKQLLFVTQIPKSYYKIASLGALLSTQCHGCKGSGSTPHKISLLGSLAHRYRLCLPFEQCLFDHLNIVRRRRNTEAAHSETQTLRKVTVQESRQRMEEDSLSAGNEFVHMLDHIADLETRMQTEIHGLVLERQAIQRHTVLTFIPVDEKS